MNVLRMAFQEEIQKREDLFFSAEPVLSGYRLTHHLMPPSGWMNDPNGLCFYEGRYHVFFQYSPLTAKGGLKFWGHYSSEDQLDWRYEGVALFPDGPMDCHGTYSGSALEWEGELHVFYTGNVKLEDGNYDYVHEGRKSSTIYVKSQDGIRFGPKRAVLQAKDYPEGYTCHIRDPKVWREDGRWRMLLGGRTAEDRGAALLYEGESPVSWRFRREMTTREPFGYMWECPDFFVLEGQAVLSVSPQGLSREEFRFQNLYQSGYFFLEKDWEAREEIPWNFQEWDMGFDFYAPQTFQDKKGRRLLMAWMGMPAEEEEYQNPTLEEGWQHCMTVPRELRLGKSGICQYPVRELEKLRRKGTGLRDRPARVRGPFDLELSLKGGCGGISIGEELFLDYQDDVAVLRLSQEAGGGRKRRKARIPSGCVDSVRILADTSAAEIYLNHGEVVFSTRYYPKAAERMIQIEAEGYEGNVWEMAPMRLTKRQR
ncbi:MAG: glycoside hydrolase family 32 protein [Eubacteriales bacterium]|nr:glycoside hydrolase family 32 protein [Eubacteriales bacterium]